MTANNAPFRADMVGSLLRSATLKAAREKHEKKQMSDAELMGIEDPRTAGYRKQLTARLF